MAYEKPSTSLHTMGSSLLRLTMAICIRLKRMTEATEQKPLCQLSIMNPLHRLDTKNFCGACFIKHSYITCYKPVFCSFFPPSKIAALIIICCVLSLTEVRGMLLHDEILQYHLQAWTNNVNVLFHYIISQKFHCYIDLH